MASQKSSSVIEALKGRKGFGSKKGVSLLGLVKKLSAKRAASKEGKNDTAKHESSEPASKESSEESMMNGKGGCGTKK